MSVPSLVERPVEAVRRSVPTVLPVVVVGGLLFVLLQVSTMSTLTAGAAVGAAGLLFLVAAAGFEGSAVALLVVGVGLSPLDALHPVPALTFVSVGDLFLLLGFMALLPVILGRSLTIDAPFALAAGVLFVVCVGVSVVSDAPGASLNSTVRLVVGALTLPLVFSLWRPGLKIATTLAFAYVVGNNINLVTSFFRGVGDGGRRIGYSNHPNVMGLAAMLGLALIPFLLRVMPRQWHWLVCALGLGCLYGIWVSGSRAALLVAVAVLALWVLLSRSVAVALTLFGAAIPVFYVVARAYLDGDRDSGSALGRLFGGGSASASDQARELLARQAWDVFQAHPVLGAGLADVMEAHNIYLQVAAAVGVVGAAIFVGLLGSVALRAFSLPERATLLVLPVLGYAMVGVMTTILWDRYVWSVLALPFLVATRNESDPDPGPDAVETADPVPPRPDRALVPSVLRERP
ncbi:MAG: hypothetical protein PGN07_09840 [Aeromicrobium erythreum]